MAPRGIPSEGSWLERSGQRWKARNPWLATLVLATLVFVVGLLSNAGEPPLWSIVVMFVLAAVARIAGLVLPLLIRCRVCGVQLTTSSAARHIPLLNRPAWAEVLQACPVCGDDGRAALEAIRAWQASDRGREVLEGSVGSVLTAILIAILLIAVAVFVVTRGSR